MPLWREQNPFHVERSPIHGKGVFAIQGLKKGWLFPAPGYELTVEEPVKPDWYGQPTKHKKDDSRVVVCDDREYELYNPYCFLNYSETPNAVLWCCEGRFEVELLQDVEQGEEITIDYF